MQVLPHCPRFLLCAVGRICVPLHPLQCGVFNYRWWNHARTCMLQFHGSGIKEQAEKYKSWTEAPTPKYSKNKRYKSKRKVPVLDMHGIFERDLGKHRRNPQPFPQSTDDHTKKDRLTGASTAGPPRWERKFHQPDEQSRESGMGKIFDAEVDKILSRGADMSTSDWVQVDAAMKELRNFRAHWPTQVMKSIHTQAPQNPSDELFGAVLSLYAYSQSAGCVTVAMLALVMSILGHSQQQAHQHILLEVYAELQARTDVLDTQLAKWVIEGLAKTPRWQECFDILDELAEFCEVSTVHRSLVVEAAFRHGHPESGWKLLDQMGQVDMPPVQLTLAALFNIAANQDRNMGVQLLEVMKKFRWIPSEDTVEAIYDFFKSDPGATWIGKKVTIRNRGHCYHCKQYLEQTEALSPGDFNILCSKFLEHSLIKNDIFLSSSPDELKHFQDFLDNSDPYSVVIDGLNIALGLSPHKAYNRGSHLLAVVEYFVEHLRCNVLVMGREHMKKWTEMQTIQEKATCFFAQDSSKDDPYMLYAAFQSGPDTLLVTRDELRDHSFLLGPQMLETFRQWQRQKQVVPLHITWYKGVPEIKFKWPDKYATRVQFSVDGYHVPYENYTEQRLSFEVPNTWLCMKKEEMAIDQGAMLEHTENYRDTQRGKKR